MSGFFENNISSLGTAHLLVDLNAAQRSLETFNALSPELEATDLLEQVKDLVNITASINDLAIRSRRNSSSYLESLSASDLVHLHSVLVGTASVIEECTMFIRAVQSSLKDVSQERNAVGYVTPESRLRNQAWYNETYQALKLQTEILRLLFSAINLLHHKNDTDEHGKLSAEARSFASTLHYQIELVYPKLHAINNRDITAVCSEFSEVDILLIAYIVAKRCGCRESSDNTYPSLHKQTLRSSKVCQKLLYWQRERNGQDKSGI